jgi:hypothetical protein
MTVSLLPPNTRGQERKVGLLVCCCESREGAGVGVIGLAKREIDKEGCMVVLNKSPMCKTRISTKFAKLKIFNSKGERIVDGVRRKVWVHKFWCRKILNEPI